MKVSLPILLILPICSKERSETAGRVNKEGVDKYADVSAGKAGVLADEMVMLELDVTGLGLRESAGVL